jgi:hypothetical protein
MDTTTIRNAFSGLGCLLLAACADPSAQPPQVDSQQSQVLEPGRKLTAIPERAWAIENCASRPLPFVRLDRTEIVPATVKPGASVIYRFPFSACVPPQPGYLLGRFRTTVSLGGKEINTRSDETYPIETGGWSIDTEILVPREAQPGLYNIEAELAVKGVRVQDRLSFTVEP